MLYEEEEDDDDAVTSTCSSTIFVSDIEQNFLLRRYTTALTQCSQYLNSLLPTTTKQSHEPIDPSQDSVACDCHCNNHEKRLLLLRTPLHLSFDMNLSHPTRYISVMMVMTSIPEYQPPQNGSSNHHRKQQNHNITSFINVQKVGAMTLQSWYELSKQQQQQQQQRQHDDDDDDNDNGYRFLQPFLDTFTSMTFDLSSSSSTKCHHTHHSMSIELFDIFTRFLSSSIVGQKVEAMTLVIEFLHQLRRSNPIPVHTPPDGEYYNRCTTTISESEQISGQEIIVRFFTEMLPQSCLTVDEGTLILDYIKRGGRFDVEQDSCSNSSATIELLPSIVGAMWLHTSKAVAASTSPQKPGGSRKEMLQLCLQYCTTDDGKWPHNEWIINAFAQCRKVLQRQLYVLYYNNNNNGPPIRSSSTAAQNTSSHFNNHNKEIVNVNATEDPPSIQQWTKQCLVARQLCQSIYQSLRSLLWEKLQALKLLSYVTTTSRYNKNTSSSLSSSPHNSVQPQVDGNNSSRIRIIEVITAVMLFSLYRYRHSMSRMVRTAVIIAIWQPIQEIIQALRHS